jgi:hypothetical protein
LNGRPFGCKPNALTAELSALTQVIVQEAASSVNAVRAGLFRCHGSRGHFTGRCANLPKPALGFSVAGVPPCRRPRRRFAAIHAGLPCRDGLPWQFAAARVRTFLLRFASDVVPRDGNQWLPVHLIRALPVIVAGRRRKDLLRNRLAW